MHDTYSLAHVLRSFHFAIPGFFFQVAHTLTTNNFFFLLLLLLAFWLLEMYNTLNVRRLMNTTSLSEPEKWCSRNVDGPPNLIFDA